MNDNECLRTYKALIGSFGNDLRRSERLDNPNEILPTVTVIAVKVNGTVVVRIEHCLSVPRTVFDAGCFESIANVVEHMRMLGEDSDASSACHVPSFVQESLALFCDQRECLGLLQSQSRTFSRTQFCESRCSNGLLLCLRLFCRFSCSIRSLVVAPPNLHFGRTLGNIGLLQTAAKVGSCFVGPLLKVAAVVNTALVAAPIT